MRDYILVCPADSHPDTPGRHLDAESFDVHLVSRGKVTEMIGSEADDLEDRLLAAVSDLGIDEPGVAFVSAESGMLGPVDPDELVDLLMQEILDTIDDAEETTDNHPLEMVRTALGEMNPR